MDGQQNVKTLKSVNLPYFVSYLTHHESENWYVKYYVIFAVFL